MRKFLLFLIETIADIAQACPTWLFRQGWNLVKVTRRGPVASDELCRIRNDYQSFWISFR